MDFSEFDNEVAAKPKDYVGFIALETDIYTGTVKDMYLKKSPGGAKAIHLEVEFPDGNKFIKDIYFTDKNGKHTYKTKPKDGSPGVDAFLPGFVTVDDLFLCTTGKPFKKQTAEEKLKKIYNKEAEKEVPTPMPTFTEAIDKPISLAIRKVLESKNVKQGEVYVATSETMENNEIAQVLHAPTKCTVQEIRETKQGEKPVSTFWEKWVKKNKGKVTDKRTYKGPPGGGAGGSSSSAGADDGEDLFK